MLLQLKKEAAGDVGAAAAAAWSSAASSAATKAPQLHSHEATR